MGHFFNSYVDDQKLLQLGATGSTPQPLGSKVQPFTHWVGQLSSRGGMVEQGAAAARMVQEVQRPGKFYQELPENGHFTPTINVDSCGYWRCRHDTQHFGPKREGKIRKIPWHLGYRGRRTQRFQRTPSLNFQSMG